MGRLFTYMVKAAAGEQPAPGPEFYTFWVNPKLMNNSSSHRQYAQLKRGRGVPYSPSGWSNLATQFGHITPAGRNRDYAQQANFAKGMYDASVSPDKNVFFEMPGAENYAVALNSNFTSPAAIYEYLESRPEYLAALEQLADKGDWTKLQHIWKTAGDVPGMTDPTLGWRPDHLLSGGAGNAQLILNMRMAEDARRKKAAEGAQQSQVQPPAAPVTASGGQPATPEAASVQAPATNPQQPKVQAPAVPEAASFYKHLGPLAAIAPKAAQSGYKKYLAPAGSLINKMQENLAAGKSMYDGMTADTPGMTSGQRQALTARGLVGDRQQQAAALAAAQENAAKNGIKLPNSEHDAYTGAGLRMVGHSADGRTRTYVGKSGRGRITVGDDARSGYHYRGNGNVDRNVQSNYTDLRQPNTAQAVTPPTVTSVRTKSTAPRR